MVAADRYWLLRVTAMGRHRAALPFGLLAIVWVATLISSPVAVGAGSNDTCQPATEGAGLFEVGIHTRVSEPGTRIELELHVSADGQAEASGIVIMENTIAVLERGTSW
jgi:hypothetical protein